MALAIKGIAQNAATSIFDLFGELLQDTSVEVPGGGTPDLATGRVTGVTEITIKGIWTTETADQRRSLGAIGEDNKIGNNVVYVHLQQEAAAVSMTKAELVAILDVDTIITNVELGQKWKIYDTEIDPTNTVTTLRITRVK